MLNLNCYERPVSCEKKLMCAKMMGKKLSSKEPVRVRSCELFRGTDPGYFAELKKQTASNIDHQIKYGSVGSA